MPGANTRTVTHYDPFPVVHRPRRRVPDLGRRRQLVHRPAQQLHAAGARPRAPAHRRGDHADRGSGHGLGGPRSDRPAGRARRAPLRAHAVHRPGALHQLGHRGGDDGGARRTGVHRQGRDHHAVERVSRQLGPGLAERHRRSAPGRRARASCRPASRRSSPTSCTSCASTTSAISRS